MKTIPELLKQNLKQVLLVSELELELDEVLGKLVGDTRYYQQYNTIDYNPVTRYVVIGSNHPNISFIALRLKNPIWIDTSTSTK